MDIIRRCHTRRTYPDTADTLQDGWLCIINPTPLLNLSALSS